MTNLSRMIFHTVLLLVILVSSHSCILAKDVDIKLESLDLDETGRLRFHLAVSNNRKESIYIVKRQAGVRIDEDINSRTLSIVFGFPSEFKRKSANDWPSSVFLEPPLIELETASTFNLELSWQMRLAFPYIPEANRFVGTPWAVTRQCNYIKGFLPLFDGRVLNVKIRVAYGLRAFKSQAEGGDRWKEFMTWQEMKTVTKSVRTIKKKHSGEHCRPNVKYRTGPDISTWIERFDGPTAP